jgi:hypothetical protein
MRAAVPPVVYGELVRLLSLLVAREPCCRRDGQCQNVWVPAGDPAEMGRRI